MQMNMDKGQVWAKCALKHRSIDKNIWTFYSTDTTTKTHWFPGSSRSESVNTAAIFSVTVFHDVNNSVFLHHYWMVSILNPIFNDSLMDQTACLIVIQSNDAIGSVIWLKNHQQIQLILIINIQHSFKAWVIEVLVTSRFYLSTRRGKLDSFTGAFLLFKIYRETILELKF